MAEEADLKTAVMARLEKAGLRPYRISPGVFGKRFVKTAPNGWPDLTVILPPQGQFLGIELKARKGRVSAPQEAMRDEIQEMGGVYVVVRSVAELETVLEELGYA
jgi:hypothetical protein